MANPQAENGHLRIANEIWEQIMMTQFNREQRAILDLVLRMSWGCGKKAAYIPKQRHFCLAGVYESHVKKELKWLERANVLIIDWDRKLYQLNKDHETWRVSIVPNYDDDELAELVRINLLMSKNQGSEDLQISKPKPQDLQISKDQLTNKEDLEPENLQISKLDATQTGSTSGFEARLKPVFKTNRKTDRHEHVALEKRADDEEDLSVGQSSPFRPVYDAYHRHIGLLSDSRMRKLQEWHTEHGLALDLIVHAIEVTASEKPRAPDKYLDGILRNCHNEGVFSLADVKRRERDGPASHEGRPNAAAYAPVDGDLVARWKQLYPDEYDA